jgi:polar amino acid transport system substrate-binding protein
MVQRRRAYLAIACAAPLAWLVLPTRAGATDAARTITLPATVDSLEGRQVRYALDAAYAVLNTKVNFVPRPALRALMEADSGQLDGEVMRPRLIEGSYHNLLRVDVPLYSNMASAFVRAQSGPAPANLEALSKSKSVGIVRGIRHAEAATQGWANVVVINSYPAAVRMLSQGLIEVLLGGEGTIREAFVSNHLDASQFNGQQVYSTPLYHYLHKRHAELLPLVQAELAKIKGQQATVLEGLLASSREGVPR